MQHSNRESRRYGQHKSQEGVVGQHTVGEESGKTVKGQEGERERYFVQEQAWYWQDRNVQ